MLRRMQWVCSTWIMPEFQSDTGTSQMCTPVKFRANDVSLLELSFGAEGILQERTTPVNANEPT